MHRKVQLIVSGGIRTGADVAKAMALGADAVAIGTAALIALGDNNPKYAAEYEKKLGSAAGFYDDFQDGRDPAGISTQDPELAARLDRSTPAVGWPTICGCSRWKRRPSPAPAARHTCCIWNPRTWLRSPSRPPPWPGCRWPVRRGFRGAGL